MAYSPVYGRGVTTIYTSYGVFPCKCVPFGDRVYISRYFGNRMPLKPPFGWRDCVYKPNAQNIQTFVFTAAIPTKLCTLITMRKNAWQSLAYSPLGVP